MKFLTLAESLPRGLYAVQIIDGASTKAGTRLPCAWALGALASQYLSHGSLQTAIEMTVTLKNISVGGYTQVSVSPARFQ